MSFRLVSDMMTKSSGAWIAARGQGQGQGQKVSAVRSLSTILPFADCGTSLHPNSEAARRLLSLRCSDFRFLPIVEVVVDMIDGALRPVSCWSPTADDPVDPVSMWMTLMRPARDRHEQNMELVRVSGGRLSLLPIKLVSPGQELLLWYGEELARTYELPIISPSNITNNGHYVCTACKSCFSYPNSLKSHILFDCHQLPVTRLLVDTSLLVDKYRSSPTFSPPLYGAPTSATDARAVTSSGHIGGHGLFLCDVRRERNHHGNSCNGAHSSEQQRHRFRSDAGSCRSLDDVTSGALRQTSLFPRAALTGVVCGRNLVKSDWLSTLMTSDDDATVNGRRRRNRSAYVTRWKNEANRVDGEEGKSTEEESKTRRETETERNLLSPGAAAPKRLCHRCNFCGKLYSRRYGLTIHLRTHSGQKPLQCKVCLRSFGDPSNLNKHVRLHGNGEAPYGCRHCDKVLVRKRDLERHVRSRHPNHVTGI